MTITLTILAVALAVLSGIAKAICDLSEEGKLKFYKKTFWLKEFSWVNKYKNNDPKQGAKFLGSTTIFVMFTDAWHLFGFLQRISLVISFALVGYIKFPQPYITAIAVTVNYLIFIGVFHIFHTYKILKK